MTRKPAAILIVTALALFALLLLPAAFAAKGGNGGGKGKGNGGGGSGDGSSSLVLVVLDQYLPDANWGEQVTFQVSTTATDKPYVNVNCYQGGTLVYSSSAGFFDGYAWPWTQIFTLRSNAWSGGEADCNAALQYWNGRSFSTLTSLSFPVAA